MLSYTTNSPAETQALGCRIGAAVKPGTCIAYFGGMGAGKTTFTRGLAAGLGLPDLVSSPTFALVNEYHAPGCLSIYHFDMYRVTSPEALESAGFLDYPLADSVFVIEWAENIEEELPQPLVKITITGSGDQPRQITLEGEEQLDDFSG